MLDGKGVMINDVDVELTLGVELDVTGDGTIPFSMLMFVVNSFVIMLYRFMDVIKTPTMLIIGIVHRARFDLLLF